jgi:hypothetical protein
MNELTATHEPTATPATATKRYNFAGPEIVRVNKKKSEPSPRSVIAGKIRTLLKRESVDDVAIGKLLNEASDLIDHGRFGRWLAQNFRMSARTARRYMGLARYYAAEKDSLSEMKFRRDALYLLAGGRLPPNVKDRAFMEAKTAWVDARRIRQIKGELENSEAAAGAPEPTSREQTYRSAFTDAVGRLAKIMTKPAAMFVCLIEAHDLENVADFLRMVAEASKKNGTKPEPASIYKVAS